MTIKGNLVMCYQNTMEHETAIQLYKEVEEEQLKTLGPTHTIYLTIKRNLVRCYQNTMEYETANFIKGSIKSNSKLLVHKLKFTIHERGGARILNEMHGWLKDLSKISMLDSPQSI